VWQYEKSWHCVEHGKGICNSCYRRAKHPTFGKDGQVVYLDMASNSGHALKREVSGAQYSGHVGKREDLSNVGKQTSQGLACPKCGGTQFTAKRSMKGKVAIGVFAPKTQVKCVACGTMFKRG
jgi:hypothetical protein